MGRNQGIKYPTFANWLQQRGKRAQKIDKEKPVRWLEATMASPTDEKELKGFTGFGLTDEQPILFAESRGADRVLDQVLVDFEGKRPAGCL